jgi:hypothetical protein
MKRYVIQRKRVMARGKLVGFIVRLSDGTSYFEQTKRVGRGHCVNYGPQWTRT